MQKLSTSLSSISTNAIALFDDDMDYDMILEVLQNWYESWKCVEKPWIAELFEFRDKEMPHISNDELLMYVRDNVSLSSAMDAMYEG